MPATRTIKRLSPGGVCHRFVERGLCRCQLSSEDQPRFEVFKRQASPAEPVSETSSRVMTIPQFPCSGLAERVQFHLTVPSSDGDNATE